MSEKKEAVRVTFEPVGKTVSGESSDILELALDANAGLRGECSGKGVCGKCRVQVVRLYGTMNPPTEKEREHLGEDELSAGYRLGCQAKLLSGSCTVYIPPESRTARREISAVVLDDDVDLRPLVRRVELLLQAPSFADARPDLERLKDALWAGVDLPLPVLSGLPGVLRRSGWNVSVTLWNNKVISVKPTGTGRGVLGVAIDIGSSKIICHLVSLETGATVAAASAENPQIMYGEDVVSRITYASGSSENLEKLRSLVVGAINTLIGEACLEACVSPDDVCEVVFVGNSVMHHLFLGIMPKYIGKAPFVPAAGELLSFPAGDVGLSINPLGMVTAVPLIGGFIGSDAVANLLITRVYEKEEVSLVIDIGTNSEIILGNSDGLMACSAPSGPSFEGAHISSGMKAVSGAIESVKIEGDDVVYTTIDGAKPRGICGSGIIDLVAGLYSAGIITRTGKFRTLDHPRIKAGNPPEFIVAGSEETGIDSEISVTEKDINEFLLAKGSLKAGWTVLCERYGIEPENIEKVYLAGSFGTHVDTGNAVILNILPPVEPERIVFAGETAVGGAKIALKSVTERERIKQILGKLEYIELSVEKSFQREYLKSIPISGA